MLRVLIFSLGCFLPVTVHAQPTADTLQSDLRSDSASVYDDLQRVLDEQRLDTETTSRAVEALTRLTRNPLNVNRASASELSALPQLSPALARRIVRYRVEHGAFASLDALAGISGLNRSLLRAVRSYLTVASTNAESAGPYPSPPSLNTIVSNLELDLLQRMTRELDPGRGFQSDSAHTTFQGSPMRLTTRVRVGYQRRVQFALTLDKDPGEALRWQPQTATYGFDHITGNFALRDIGRLETVVVGDFSAQFGQGVALWRGLSFGKGRDPVSPLIRSGRGLVPYQSTAENRFFRGVGATVALTPSLSVTAFGSRHHRDATLDSSRVSTEEAAGPPPARTLSVGGQHRTPGELAGKDAFGLTTVGGAFEYQTPNLHLGLVGYQSRFDRPLRPPPQPDQRYDVSGTQTSMVSAFATTFVGNYTLFGEVARAPSGRYGVLAGGSLDHEAGVQALLLARRFPKAFQGLYNSAIGESGSTQNEVGVYTGLRLQVSERWSVSAYVDQYRHPWLRFSVPRPSSGIDTRVVVEYDPRPWLSTSVQVRAEQEEKGTERRGPNGRLLSAVQPEERQSVRWHTEYTFSDALTLRTRLQGARASTSAAPSYGVLLYQGFRFQPLPALHFDARVAFFDTDGFAARLYAYEHDLLYSFSVPVLFGQGQRSYLLVQYEPTSSLTFEAKYGVTWYPHRRTIGSGLNATDGPRVRELRLQVRWQI
mgnify:CR=1 FL=1